MSKSMPSFIKRWENKRRKVKRGKRKEKQVITVAPMKSSMSVLLLLEWLRMWGGEGGREGLCVCGGVLFAVILTMPYMPYVVVPSSWARSCCQAECPVS